MLGFLYSLAVFLHLTKFLAAQVLDGGVLETVLYLTALCSSCRQSQLITLAARLGLSDSMILGWTDRCYTASPSWVYSVQPTSQMVSVLRFNFSHVVFEKELFHKHENNKTFFLSQFSAPWLMSRPIGYSTEHHFRNDQATPLRWTWFRGRQKMSRPHCKIKRHFWELVQRSHFAESWWALGCYNKASFDSKHRRGALHIIATFVIAPLKWFLLPSPLPQLVVSFFLFSLHPSFLRINREQHLQVFKEPERIWTCRCRRLCSNSTMVQEEEVPRTGEQEGRDRRKTKMWGSVGCLTNVQILNKRPKRHFIY